jgi:GntR family transcriptional repressor for pyruvate dehydrogenase complex
MRTALEEHAEILEALEARDGDRAASAMITHMASARARILRAAEEPAAD